MGPSGLSVTAMAITQQSTRRGCPVAAITDNVGLLRQGYTFASRVRRQRTGADDDRPVPVHLLGRRALLLRGVPGVRTFYDTSLVEREGAMPLPIRGSLFGAGAVHGLDDEAHRHRKATFVRVCYDDAQVERIAPMVEAELREAHQRWSKHPDSVYDSTVIAYGRAALRWAGIEGRDAELDVQARRLGDIVEGFGHLSLDHVRAWRDRARTDRWFAQLIRDQRAGRRTAAPGTSLHEWAAHRELDGTLLDPRTAGIELQNTIRPHIAVSRFAAFAAKALVEHPQWRERIQAETAERGTLAGGPLATAFAQEVRRTALFVPMLPAFARTDFEHHGEKVTKRERVLIDILGSNTDPEAWENPESFDPERFVGLEGSAYERIEAFIPQGGGDVRTGHRCPGEKIVIGSLASTIAVLSEDDVVIHEEGLEVDPHRMPTKPASGAIVHARA